LTQVITLTMGGDTATLNYLSKSLEEGVPALILKQNKNKEGANILANALERFSANKLSEFKSAEGDDEKEADMQKELEKLFLEQKKGENSTPKIEEEPKKETIVEGLKCLKTTAYVSLTLLYTRGLFLPELFLITQKIIRLSTMALRVHRFATPFYFPQIHFYFKQLYFHFTQFEFYFAQLCVGFTQFSLFLLDPYFVDD